MKNRLSIALWLVILGFALVACSGGSLGASEGQDVEAVPTAPQLTLGDAEGVAGAFLDAWIAQDYISMYRLISFRSREAYPEADFTAIYEDATTEMTLTEVEYVVRSSLHQGSTVSISYDVTFHTGLLGDIFDNGRIMRLVATDEGWRVAWATTDIFSELAGGAFLLRESLLPVRANIYDRNEQALVTQSGVAIMVSVVQENIPELEDCNATLTRILRLSYGELQDIYDSRAPNWITIVGEIDTDTYTVEEELLRENCDAAFEQRPTRRYVSGGLAPHIIGYVGFPTPELRAEVAARGIPQDALVGLLGVERAWDAELTGRPGGLLQIISPTGGILRTLAQIEPGRSESVYLTLDAELQLIVQQAFSDAYNVANWAPGSSGAAAVVLDIHTGEILALASYPSFDPNLFNPDRSRPDAGSRLQDLLADPRNPQINRATQGAYPPGSVFKLVTAIAVADSGTYDLNQSYVCTGVWYGDQTRYGWKPGGHGTLTLPQAITGSCNPYFYEAGFNLDANNPNLLPNYAVRLGFGVPTGLQDLDENPGLVPNPDYVRAELGRIWTVSDAVNMAIGQGELQVTPLQMARLVAAIANGGTFYVPQVVQRVELRGDDPSYVMEPEVSGTIGVNPVVIDTIYDAMCEVTTNPTLGTAEYVFGATSSFGESSVRACGKTGTAQAGGEGVRPHAWFAAFAPAEEPEIAVVVIVENSREGSEVAAPIVRRILEQYFGEIEGPYAPEWWPPVWWTGDYQELTTPGA